MKLEPPSPLRNNVGRAVAEATPWVVVGVVGGMTGLGLAVGSRAPLPWAFIFIALGLSPFLALIVGNLRRALLAIIMLDTPLQIDANLFYHSAAGKLGSIGGLNFSLTTIALSILYALWIAELLAVPISTPRVRLRASLPAGLYLLATTLSVLAARSPALAWFGVWQTWQCFLLFTYLASTVRERGELRFLFSMLLVGLGVESLLIVGSGVAHRTVHFAGLSLNVAPSYERGRIWRAGGTIGSPTVAAAYLTLILSPAFAMWAYRHERGALRVAWLPFLLGLAALAVTQSRGGAMGLGVALSIVLLALALRHRLRPSVPTILVVLALLTAPLTYPLVAGRIVGSDNGSASSRVPLNDIALSMIAAQPLTGVGVNNFATALPEFITPDFSRSWLYTVHNKYLLEWAETGILGLATYLGFLLIALHWGWRLWRSDDPLLAPLGLGFAAAIAGAMVHMGFTIYNTRAEVQMLWTVAGLLAAMRMMLGPRLGRSEHRMPDRSARGMHDKDRG